MSAEPSAAPNLASIGALLGDPTRVLMLDALHDGRAWTAGELARSARVTPQTASTHLRRLLEAGLLSVAAQGRHRYFRLASAEVADALEALNVLATRRTTRPGLCSGTPDSLRAARTCYDHLAGRLGVALIEALVARRLVTESEDAYALTDAGSRLMHDLGVDLAAARARRRAFARKCLDWSERRHHLAGALGAALAAHFFDARWIRAEAGSRAVSVTPRGRRGLRDLGVAVD